MLALNYMDQLGGRLRLRPTLRFLWLRLARIWPLYMLVILGAAALRVLRHELWHSAPVGNLTWPMLGKQALMVQQWFPPERGQTSWVGPAWSLSAEWLAYLAFPIVVLAVARLHRGLRAGTLLVLAGSSCSRWSWGSRCVRTWAARCGSLRILCEFVAGMLLCAAASTAGPDTRGVRRLAGYGALLTTSRSSLALRRPRAVPSARGGPSTWWCSSSR